MKSFLERSRAVWGNAQLQDIAEYLAMLAVILLLVIGTLKLITKHPQGSIPSPASAHSQK